MVWGGRPCFVFPTPGKFPAARGWRPAAADDLFCHMPFLPCHVRWLVTLPALLLAVAPAAAQVPAWLPTYDLDVRLDTANHTASVRARVTCVNRHARPASQLVFNNHAHYKLADKDVGMTAKIFEI